MYSKSYPKIKNNECKYVLVLKYGSIRFCSHLLNYTSILPFSTKPHLFCDKSYLTILF